MRSASGPETGEWAEALTGSGLCVAVCWGRVPWAACAYTGCGVCELLPGAGSREPGAGSREPGCGSRAAGVGWERGPPCGWLVGGGGLRGREGWGGWGGEAPR
ncbi:hypothetical protein San01_40950 [Streptomyces angustmyceticus]|uniref:Uncharacterized protein n=1 Tax=Streptomyces angustmyceticus TaxID=285578 RepID=A0A5J4LM27_9ACTN|nr:hypothetical protein San01_40950 [Streptomyces angustmyceticus]